jgi:hypothetical protein
MTGIVKLTGALGLAVAALSAAALTPGLAQEGSWGTVKGRIIWGGAEVPKREPLDLKENPDKMACLKNGPLLDETWVVHPKNKGLRHTFVWLQAPKGSELPIHPSLKEVKEKKIVMDQPVCMFIPHATALREGQVLVAKNSAAIAHNFKWSGHPDVNPGSNVLMPPATEKIIDDLKADRFPVSIECNIHPWMRGWVRVFDHPYFAVTDESGNFEFKDAPAGDWQLMVWHGSGGWLGGAKGRNGQPITVKAGVTDTGSLEYPPPAN